MHRGSCRQAVRGSRCRRWDASLDRWERAITRAMDEGIQVRQLAGSGAWIANSGRDDSVAYELDVTGNVAHGCSCRAGLEGDPVCKHRAAFYLMLGALSAAQKSAGPALHELDQGFPFIEAA